MFKLGLNDTIQKQHLSSKRSDTLVISLDKERLVTLESKAALGKNLLARPGDTLFVELRKGELNVKSTFQNSFVNLYQSQFSSDLATLQDSLYAQLVQTDSLQGMAVSNDYSSKVLYPIFFQKEFYQNHPEVIQEFTNAAYAEANGLLNKLRKESPLEKANTLTVKEEVQLNRIFQRISFLGRQLKNEAYTTDFLASPFFTDELLMQSANGISYLFTYITDGVLKGERRTTSNRRYVEYAKAYDLLDAHFEGPMLARARVFCLERMVSESESYETISAYATAYQNTYPEDTLFMKTFSENFLIGQEALVQSKIGLNLLLENGSNKMLTGLLNELKGKVVYVDYWASWCAPCREAMPNSLRLKEKLEGKEVAFVYFSVDNGQEAWKKASANDGLEGYRHNYLVLNHAKSQMKKNLGIDAIPRYLIFNKEGKLVEDKAPSPLDENLETVLNRYIAN